MMRALLLLAALSACSPSAAPRTASVQQAQDVEYPVYCVWKGPHCLHATREQGPVVTVAFDRPQPWATSQEAIDAWGEYPCEACYDAFVEHRRRLACLDGAQDYDETDADCGGPDCAPCPPGGGCATTADCNLCYCVAGRCTTDVDAGVE